jgi:hypothetical protein
MRLWATIILVACAALPALAEGWGVYGNARFSYLMPLPPGFSAIAEADNSDGGTSRSADGTATLAVWGTNLLDTPFETEVAQRMASDEADGWKLGYRQANGAGASWSGTRNGRVLYMRAVPLCADEAAFFRLEYAEVEKKAYDAVVARMVKGFGGEGASEG